MCNRFYKYLIEEEILYQKQFSFQAGHSKDNSIVKLVD